MAIDFTIHLNDDQEKTLLFSHAVVGSEMFDAVEADFVAEAMGIEVKAARKYLESDDTVTAIPKSDDECLKLFRASSGYETKQQELDRLEALDAELAALENQKD